MTTATEGNVAQIDELLRQLEQVELRLRRQEEGLGRSHRLAMLGTMAASIAHEYNNILTPMISYCQLALGSPQEAALAQKALKIALDGAQRAARIGETMLGFARHGGDEEGSCDVAKVVRDTLECMARPAEKDRIRLTVNVPEGCTAAIEGLHLQQVLLNLIINARRAMAPKGGRLDLTARRVGEDESTTEAQRSRRKHGDDRVSLKKEHPLRGLCASVVNPSASWVEITLADTGPGIPADILPTVFEPFVTSDEHSSSNDSHGTGLGLAICRELIERAEGKIEIPRSDSSGTTFLIRLPVKGAGE